VLGFAFGVYAAENISILDNASFSATCITSSANNYLIMGLTTDEGNIIINTTGNVSLDCSGSTGANLAMGAWGDEGGILLTEVGVLTLKWVGAGDPTTPYPFTYNASDFTVTRPEPNVEIYTYGGTVGIVGVELAPSREVTGYYNIHGQKLPQEPESGLYIIMYDNGKVEKVFKQK